MDISVFQTSGKTQKVMRKSRKTTQQNFHNSAEKSAQPMSDRQKDAMQEAQQDFGNQNEQQAQNDEPPAQQ